MIGRIRAAVLGDLAGTLTAAATAYLANRAAVRRSAVPDRGNGVVARWQRTNHAGRPVTLLEGPAAAAGALAGLVVGRRLANAPVTRTLADGIAVGCAAAVGGYDDLAGSTQAKGFRGHLGALRQGRLTSGMIKMAGISASALAASVIDSRPGPARRRVADVVIDTGLVATTANLANLLDLRPGRAAKAVIGGGLAAGGVLTGAGPLVGAALGVLPGDLAEQSMLGDCGANALGAGLGRVTTRLPRPVRMLLLAGLLLANLASERISFTAVIAAHPRWDALDRWGRLPAPDRDARRDGSDAG